MKIWCLFHIDNNYDQPDYNLVCFWQDKPTVEMICKAMKLEYKNKKQKAIAGKIYRGQEERIYPMCGHYRIEEVSEKQILEERQ